MSATLPAHAYISSENVDNDCSEKGEITLNTQSQAFQTLRYRHKAHLGSISGADVNPFGAVSTAIGFKCGLFSSFGCPPTSSAWSVCGGSVWYYSRVPDSRGTFDLAATAWMERMKNAFNDIDSEIGAEFSFHPQGPPAAAGDGGAERARHVCNANRHINASDMLQGIVPGTCSDLYFETENQTFSKYGTDGTSIHTGTVTLRTIKAYVSYDYIRPVTIQDKLKGYSAESEGYACSQDGTNRTSQHNNATHDDYPAWYAQSLGVETTDTLGYPIQNYGRSANYVRKKTDYSKNSSCGDSLTTCQHRGYYKDGNPQYPYGGAPCGKNDYLCWSKNRDWISVWLDYGEIN